MLTPSSFHWPARQTFIGSILTPGLEAVVLAPICPHTLSNRPIVVPSTSVIEIRATRHSRANSLVSFDGQCQIDLEPKDTLRCDVGISNIRLSSFMREAEIFVETNVYCYGDSPQWLLKKTT